jgi:hypothetical protein
MKPGDAVRYKSFAGPVYDAVVVTVSPDGRFADLDVNVGVRDKWRLTGVRMERIEVKEKS